MLKKLLMIALFLSFIPIVQTQAIVRDSDNLIKSGWQQFNFIPGPPFAGESFFTSPLISNLGINSLSNDLGVKANYVQLFIPYHPNILITNCDPAFPGCAAQYLSFINFSGTNVSDKQNAFRNIYQFTLNVDEETGTLGWSTVIPVDRSYNRFYITVQTNLLNTTIDNTKKAVILELLQTQAKLQIVVDPEATSYLFNPFSTSGSFMVSDNNLLPETAIRELIVYIDPRYSARYTSHFSSVIIFKNANGITTTTKNFTQATYTRTGNVKGYYVFNLDDPEINKATKFEIKIFLVATTSVLTEIPQVNSSFYYNFDDQIHYATFYSGLNLLKRQPFSLLIPTPDFTVPSGFSYWRWNNPLSGEIEIFDETYVPNQDVVLYSGTTSTIVPDPVVPDVLGGINGSFDTILLNTGFLNPGGLLLIYFMFVVGIAVMVLKLELSSLIAIVLNILLTSFFLILGYLPLYAAILLIVFYIIAIISINKGGFLNE